MRKTLAAATLAAALAAAAAAQDAPEAAIQDTIQSQIDAFLADDFATAFTFASPAIKDIFRTPENFGRMVQQGYPMVWRPQSVEYLDLREAGSARIQRVLIQDASGRFHVLDYQMVRTENGWQINGVSILPAPQAGA